MRIYAAVICSLFLGCTGDGVPAPVRVQGKVTMQGTPVAGAKISYSAISEGLPARYRFAQGTTDDEGHYEIADVYPAVYMVTVFKSGDTGETPAEGMASPGDPAFKKYEVESPLRAEVSKEKTDFDFDLEPSGRRSRK